MANLKTERLVVTVRTYPTPSTSHREVVCTGAVAEDGSWRRLYPMPLRYLKPDQQFKTWNEIEVVTSPSKSDRRIESRRPNPQTIRVLKKLETDRARLDSLGSGIFDSLESMISMNRSLGPVWMSSLDDVHFKPCSTDWTPIQLSAMKRTGLFNQDEKALPLDKIPYEFRFIWRDGSDQTHDSLVISWEIAQAWRNFQSYSDPNKVLREKLLDETFSSRSKSMLFMGNHSRWRSTFMVCGWFCPKRSEVHNEILFGSLQEPSSK